MALVYVDIEEGADPDLAIAQQIASSLDLNAVSSITDLERQISRARRKGQRFAFLIDEVDEFIKKSRLVHGDKFPLATALRQLVMDDSSKDTILVFTLGTINSTLRQSWIRASGALAIRSLTSSRTPYS